MKTVQEVIFHFFGETETKFRSDCGMFFTFENKDYHIDVILHNNKAVFSVDLNECFNKTGQCPIHFVIDFGRKLSRRKDTRIFSALNTLIRLRENAGEFFGLIPGFDDLSSENYYQFDRPSFC